MQKYMYLFSFSNPGKIFHLHEQGWFRIRFGVPTIRATKQKSGHQVLQGGPKVGIQLMERIIWKFFVKW